MASSFLGLESLHVFITGAAGGIDSEVVKEFLKQGCNVTAHDIRKLPETTFSEEWLYTVSGDISDEESMQSCMVKARAKFGPIHILVANAGITDESNEYPIWEMPLELWERTYRTNIRGTFLTIKHFLRAAKEDQQASGAQLENLAIVVTGSECGKFGQAWHSEYASGKAGLQYGLVCSVKNEIVKLNSKARINVVAPGWVNTSLIGDRLDDPLEMWAEAQATVPLKKIAQPTDVARAIAFLASHRAAGHICGQCLSVDGGMEGRLIWKHDEVAGSAGQKLAVPQTATTPLTAMRFPPNPAASNKPLVRVLLSINLDALISPSDNELLLSGLFQSRRNFINNTGVPRLIRVLSKYEITVQTTWFVPGSTTLSPYNDDCMVHILDAGAEVGIYGLDDTGNPEGSDERIQQILVFGSGDCIHRGFGLIERPQGVRVARTMTPQVARLIKTAGFTYASLFSRSETETQPLLFEPLPIEVPSSPSSSDSALSARASGALPDVRVLEQQWKDRFEWIAAEAEELGNKNENKNENNSLGAVFPLVLHPEISGQAHVIRMIDRFLGWLLSREGAGRMARVEFIRCEEAARLIEKEKRAGGR